MTDEDAARLCSELGGLPLALSHAAAYLRRTRTVSINGYLQRLSERMSQAPKGVEYPQAVFATFRAAALRAEEESPGSIAVLCLSSFFSPDEIPERLLKVKVDGSIATLHPLLSDAAALDTSLGNPGRIEENLGALDHFSLIIFFIERRRFQMHRLVQAAGRALVEADISAWVMCAVQLVHAGLLNRDDAIKAINTDLDNIRYILRWAIENKKDVSGGASILNRLSTFWQATGKYAEAHRWYESVLALSDLVPKDLYTRLLLDAGAIEIFRDNFDRSSSYWKLQSRCCAHRIRYSFVPAR